MKEHPSKSLIRVKKQNKQQKRIFRAPELSDLAGPAFPLFLTPICHQTTPHSQALTFPETDPPYNSTCREADNTRQQVGGCGASLSPRGCYSPQVPVGSSAGSQPLFFPELFRSLLFVPVKVRAGLDRGR
ncbi:hypothetical protein DVH24_028759 [Malus domestica]|uniref:Uncharacterized protein n=1 Tax=Malus domestica TaxID=3750 RepID=A0A498IV91_MALDO|nr:hypothetical protein DVH24_028759 [Malus domestica]